MFGFDGSFEVVPTVYFGKTREDAKIPAKRYEDAGYDIYACFDEDFILIPAHETKMITTGLISAFSTDYVGILKERGSTGTQGMAQRAGVIDSGYRGEWLVPITNTTEKDIVIAKDIPEIKRLAEVRGWTIYPYEKAICQCIFVETPVLLVKEATVEEIMSIASERKEGRLGSSGK